MRVTTEKTGNNARALSLFFRIAVALQVAMGVLFLIAEFGKTFQTPETWSLELGARSGITDEYIGILYPLLMRVFLWLQTQLGIPYYLPLFFAQAAALGFGLFWFHSALWQDGKRLGVTLLVLTFPTTMTTLLTVSQFSLRGAFGFLLLGFGVRFWKRGGKKFLLGIGISFWLLALNYPADFWIWGAVILCGAFWLLFQKKTALQRVMISALCLAMILPPFLVQKKIEISGSYGTISRSVDTAVFTRALYENPTQNWASLQDLLPPEMSQVEWKDMSRFENLRRNLGPGIDVFLGSEEATRFYKEADLRMLGKHPFSFVAGLLGEALYYSFQPAAQLFVLKGVAGTRSEELSDMLGDMRPAMLGYRVASTMLWMAFALVGFVLFIKKTKSNKEKRKIGIKKLYPLFGAIWIQALIISFLDGPSWDPRYGIMVMGVVLAFAVHEWQVPSITFEREKEFLRKKEGGKLLLYGACILGTVAVLGLGRNYLEGVRQQNAREQLSGRVVCLGDSIWGLEQGETGIAALMEKQTSLQVENCAVPGSSAAAIEGYEQDAFSLMSIINGLEQAGASREVETSSEEFAGLVSRIHPETMDCLILAYGLNDYFTGTKAMGTEADSYEGALTLAVQWFREKNPDLAIVLVGPTRCLFYADGMVEETGETKDFGGGNLLAYEQAAQKVAEKNNCSYVNMWEEMEITKYNGNRYLLDGTHLTEYGRKKYTERILNHILTDNLSSAKLMGNQKIK